MKIIFVIAALLACAHAKPGGPAEYSISAPSVDHASVGNTQEHTVKGPYGQTSQSDYASQVQTAHSQSHVQRSSVSHDAGYAPHGGYGVAAVAAPIHGLAAPVAHSYAPALSLSAHAAPALAIAHAAPAATISHGISYAAPALAVGHGGLALGHGGYGGLALGHGGLALGHGGLALGHGGYGGLALGHGGLALGHGGLALGHGGYGGLALGGHGGYGYSAHGIGLAAPAYGHSVSHSYVSAPATAVKVAAAPAYADGYYGHGLGLAAHHGYAAPALTAHYAAPVVKAAVAAPALLHGHGLHYGY